MLEDNALFPIAKLADPEVLFSKASFPIPILSASVDAFKACLPIAIMLSPVDRLAAAESPIAMFPLPLVKDVRFLLPELHYNSH